MTIYTIPDPYKPKPLLTKGDMMKDQYASFRQRIQTTTSLVAILYGINWLLDVLFYTHIQSQMYPYFAYALFIFILLLLFEGFAMSSYQTKRSKLLDVYYGLVLVSGAGYILGLIMSLTWYYQSPIEMTILLGLLHVAHIILVSCTMVLCYHTVIRTELLMKAIEENKQQPKENV